MSKCFFKNKSVAELEKASLMQEKGKTLSVLSKNANSKQELSSVLHHAKLSRRDLLKTLSLLSLSITSEPVYNLILSEPAYAGGFDFNAIAGLIDVSCAFCNITGLCMRIHHGKLQFGPKIVYRLPYGFMETGAAFEFGASAPVFGGLSTVFASFARALLPFIPQGGKDIESYNGGQANMELYPHFLGFPLPLIPIIKTIIMKANIINPACVCNILNDIIEAVLPASDIVKKVQQMLGPIANKVQSVLNNIASHIPNMPGFSSGGKAPNLLQKIHSIYDKFEAAFKIFPLLPSELFFFIWILEEFSPDNYTIAPLLDSIIEDIPPLQAVCPWVLTKIPQSFWNKLPFGIDPTFVCVGHWGFGYPRIGIVRDDDPIVAGLLSIARFHHLFSRTIPVIYSEAAYYTGETFYQLYNPPISSGCFQPGYFYSDKIANMIAGQGANISIGHIVNDIEHPEQALNDLKNWAVSSGLNTLKQGALGGAPNYRNVGVVLWEQKSKCCFSV